MVENLSTEDSEKLVTFGKLSVNFQVHQCMAGLFPNHVKEKDFHLEYRNSWIIFVNIYLAHP